MNKMTLLGALLLAVISVAFWQFVNTDVKIVSTSLSTRVPSAIERTPEVLTGINKLPPELKSLKKELSALVNEVDEILSEPENEVSTESSIQLSAMEQIDLDNAVRKEYEKAGLDYDAEEAVINNAFSNASSNPVDVLGIKESN